jgi:hypothetical protein
LFYPDIVSLRDYVLVVFGRHNSLPVNHQPVGSGHVLGYAEARSEFSLVFNSVKMRHCLQPADQAK